VARRAWQRPVDQSGVVDAGLCHGAAGLAHLFNRLYQATQETWLAEAARFWFDQTLTLRRPGHGLGGYTAWHLAPHGKMDWVTDASFLTGAAGVALTLLAGVSSAEPAWDHVLLANVS
jgi:hypothetical protein